VKVLFGEGIPEVFQELPRPVQVRAARIIDLIAVFPQMYPVRRIGLMRGYRYFNVLGYYFYYSISSQEIRVAAILPGRMEQA
jgi:plasmid stabilization system protein ParE